MVLRILDVAPTVAEKGVAIKLDETSNPHFTPLDAPDRAMVLITAYDKYIRHLYIILLPNLT